MDVEYRDIPGYPGYRAGSDGSVWSNHWCKPESKRNEWKELRQAHTKKGYYYVGICRNGKQTTRGTHVFMAMAFLGQCPTGMECRHLDGNPSNNQLSNIAYGTRRENANDRKRHGTEQSGESHSRAKLTDKIVIEALRRRRAGESYTSIAKSYGVTPPCIRHAVTGHTWKSAHALIN